MDMEMFLEKMIYSNKTTLKKEHFYPYKKLKLQYNPCNKHYLVRIKRIYQTRLNKG